MACGDPLPERFTPIAARGTETALLPSGFVGSREQAEAEWQQVFAEQQSSNVQEHREAARSAVMLELETDNARLRDELVSARATMAMQARCIQGLSADHSDAVFERVFELIGERKLSHEQMRALWMAVERGLRVTPAADASVARIVSNSPPHGGVGFV